MLECCNTAFSTTIIPVLCTHQCALETSIQDSNVGSTTVGHMVVRYNFSLLRSCVHFGVLIMFSAQGFDAQVHMSAAFLIAPLTGTSIKRMPLSRTVLAATQAHARFEALPS